MWEYYVYVFTATHMLSVKVSTTLSSHHIPAHFDFIAQHKYWTLDTQSSQGSSHKQFDYVILFNMCRKNNQ